MSMRPVSRRGVIKAGVAAAASVALGGTRSVFADDAKALPAITKPIPSSGEQLPVIGLGTNAYGAPSIAEAGPQKEVLENMAKAGGKLIDTANAYGRSEVVIGELLETLDNRKDYFIATKTPIRGDYADPQALFDNSFKSLRTDKIDLMQIHNLGGLDKLMPIFENAKASGRVRYIGMSTSTDDQYKQMIASMEKYPLDFIQVDYSIENRNAETEVLKAAQEHKLAVLINVPFGGRRQATTTFAKVANRELPEWAAADYDIHSWAQFFLKFVVSHPAVTVAIPGTTKRKNMEDNQGAGRGRLPDAAGRKKMEEYWASLS